MLPSGTSGSTLARICTARWCNQLYVHAFTELGLWSWLPFISKDTVYLTSDVYVLPDAPDTFAGQKDVANLRKNPGFHLVAGGVDLIGLKPNHVFNVVVSKVCTQGAIPNSSTAPRVWELHAICHILMRRGREDGPGLDLRPCPLHLYGGYQYPTHAPSPPSSHCSLTTLYKPLAFMGPNQEDKEKRKKKRGKLEQ